MPALFSWLSKYESASDRWMTFSMSAVVRNCLKLFPFGKTYQSGARDVRISASPRLKGSVPSKTISSSVIQSGLSRFVNGSARLTEPGTHMSFPSEAFHSDSARSLVWHL